MPSLAELYYSIEDKYYSLMDRLEGAGLRVYKYFVDPIESRGVPSFPVALLVLAAVIAGAYFGISALLAAPAPVVGTTLTIAVKAADGTPLLGASVTLLVPGEPPRTAVADENGIAEFTDVPVGKKATIKVVKEGYAEYSKEVTTTTEPKSVEAQLAPPAVVEKKVSFAVYAKDKDGNPLPGALVSYSFVDPATNQLTSGTEVSNEYGVAAIQLPSEEVYLDLSASLTGYADPSPLKRYAGQKEASFVFASKISLDTDDEGRQEIKGSVYVYVKDEEGRPVQALVELYEEGVAEKIASAYADENGVAVFDNAIAVGTSITAKATPTGLAGEDYSEEFSEAKLVSELTEITLFLPGRVKEKEKYLNITVVKGDSEEGEGGEGAYGAEVKLFFLEAPSVERDYTTTDDFGRASFVLAEGATVYLTAYYEGYFPAVVTSVGAKYGLQAGDSVSIALEKALLGSFGEARVSVVDADGNAAANARVELFTSEGYFAGFPGVETDSDGTAVFPALPLNTGFKARASLGTQRGESDVFQASLAEAKEIKVVLKPATGVISVVAKDRSTGELVKAKATVFVGGKPAKDPDCVVCSCETRVLQPLGCALLVRSNKEFVVRAVADGFVSYESREVFVSANKTTELELLLMPASLANNLSVRLEGVYDPRTNVKLDDNAPLERGREYKVVLSVNIPSTAESAGVSLRVGDQAFAEEEAAEIVSFEPNENVSWSSSYNPSPDCNADFVTQEQGHAKFAAWEFSGWTGTREASARLRVKPTATSQDEVLLYYNAWASKGPVYVRSPSDPTLGEAKSTALLDWCYAQSLQEKRGVTEGRAKCSRGGEVCFAYSYRTLTGDIVGDVVRGEEFQIVLDVRSFVSLDAPVIKITAPNKELAFRSYDLVSDGVPVQGTGNDASEVVIDLRDKIAAGSATHSINGSITVLPVIQTDAAKLSYSFEDPTGRGSLLEFDDYLKIAGSGLMDLVVTPTETPVSKTASLTATISTTEAGVTRPITDARIAVEEGEGNPFNGQADLPVLKGDGTTDYGEDGVYKIRDVKPVFPGEVIVRAKRNGFQDAAFVVRATASTEEALAFEPDVAGGVFFSGDECNRTKTVKLTNQLNSRITVNVIAGMPSCVQLRVGSATINPGQSYALPLARGASATVVAMPLAGLETCGVSFNVVLSDGTQTTPLVVAFDTSECKPVVPASVQLCSQDFGEVNPPLGGCGEWASEGTCEKQSCTCPAGMTRCTPADDPSVVQQCTLKVVRGKRVLFEGYLGAACENGECSMGVCNCLDTVANKWTVALFDNFWFNYLMGRYTQMPTQYKGVAGGALIKFDAAGRISGESKLRTHAAGVASAASIDFTELEFTELAGAAEGEASFAEAAAASPTTNAAPTPTAAAAAPVDEVDMVGGDKGVIWLSVSPYVPYAGFAVVLDNSAGKDSLRLGWASGKQLGVPAITKGSGCWKIRELRPGAWDTLLSLNPFDWIKEMYYAVKGVVSEDDFPAKIGAKEGRAYAVVFDAFECPDVKKEVTAEGFKMSFREKTRAEGAADAVEYKDYGFGVGSFKDPKGGKSARFRIKIDTRPYKYALPTSPSWSSEIKIDSVKAPEPFVFANNLMSSSSKAAEKITVDTQAFEVPPRGTFLEKVGLREGFTLEKVPLDSKDNEKENVFTVRVSDASSQMKITAKKRKLPEALSESELAVYQPVGNPDKESCLKDGFCISTKADELKKKEGSVVEEIERGVEGTNAAGYRSVVAREAVTGTDNMNMLLQAFLLALYDTANSICYNDPEALECLGLVSATRPPTPQPPGMSYQTYYASYWQQGYGAQGMPGFPGFAPGMFGPQRGCDFGMVLDFLCNRFFNPKGSIQKKGYGQRLPGIALTSFGKSLCTVTILKMLGAIGPDKTTAAAPVIGGGWGGGAKMAIEMQVGEAAEEARKNLWNLEGRDPKAYREERDVELPVMGLLKPELGVPLRLLGREGGIKVQRFEAGEEGGEVRVEAKDLTSGGLLGVGGIPKGYPYVNCTTGTKGECSVEFDGLKPVLATLNKYGLEALPLEKKEQKGQEVAAVVDADFLGVVELVDGMRGVENKELGGEAVLVTSCEIGAVKGADLKECAGVKTDDEGNILETSLLSDFAKKTLDKEFNPLDGYVAVRVEHANIWSRILKRLFGSKAYSEFKVVVKEPAIPKTLSDGKQTNATGALNEILHYFMDESYPLSSLHGCEVVGATVEDVVAKCPSDTPTGCNITSASLASDNKTITFFADLLKDNKVLAPLTGGIYERSTGKGVSVYNVTNQQQLGSTTTPPSGLDAAFKTVLNDTLKPAQVVSLNMSFNSMQCGYVIKMPAPPAQVTAQQRINRTAHQHIKYGLLAPNSIVLLGDFNKNSKLTVNYKLKKAAKYVLAVFAKYTPDKKSLIWKSRTDLGSYKKDGNAPSNAGQQTLTITVPENLDPNDFGDYRFQLFACGQEAYHKKNPQLVNLKNDAFIHANCDYESYKANPGPAAQEAAVVTQSGWHEECSLDGKTSCKPPFVCKEQVTQQQQTTGKYVCVELNRFKKNQQPQDEPCVRFKGTGSECQGGTCGYDGKCKWST